MSSHPTAFPSNGIDEHRWVIQMRQALESEQVDDDDDHGTVVSIFNVPKTLMANKPDAYVPQQVAIGPYHRWRPELYDMERYKLSAAKRVQRQLPTPRFQDLVDRLSLLEPKIRSCYHRYLDFNGDTLLWCIAVDACFLLEFLQMYEKGRIPLKRICSRMSHLLDYAGTKSAHNAILRDIMMLENQIPLFLLKKIMELQFSSPQEAQDRLYSSFLGLFREVSPFIMMENTLPSINITQHAHLLELLYSVILPMSEETSQTVDYKEDDGHEISGPDEDIHRGLFKRVRSALLGLKRPALDIIKRVIFSRPVKSIVKIPWHILSNLPMFSMVKQPVEYFFFNQSNEDGTKSHQGTDTRPPLLEEIMIPSVTELVNAGVRFVATSTDPSRISFDKKTATLYLPTISIDVNTEVVLRNLVAYETSAASGPLVMTRYTELMNGIIDSEEDVRLLRERGAVLNRLQSDADVADMWNGMCKSVRLAKVAFLDTVIEDVNKYYNGRWRVKVCKFMRSYVFGSWQLLALLAAVLLLLLISLQTFCSVYSRVRS